MARIRTIKPSFWTHEDLSELPEATHMLAAQLLNYADDDGYFNANPKLIIAEVSPLREPSVSVQDSLSALWKIGYLQFGFSPEGKRYGRVVNFLEHQRINRPTKSKIKDLEICFEGYPSAHTQLTEPSLPEGNKEGNKEQEGNGIGGALSARVSEEGDSDISLDFDRTPAGLTMQAWNAMAEPCGLAKVQKLTAGRRAKAEARFKDAGGMDGINFALEKLQGSPFLLGENERGWKADFDFLLQEKSFTKLMEGAYDRATGGTNGGKPGGGVDSAGIDKAILGAIAGELAADGDIPRGN